MPALRRRTTAQLPLRLRMLHGLNSSTTNRPLLFRVPAGLAVGLALKELALRRVCGDSPRGAVTGPGWVPRSPYVGRKEIRLDMEVSARHGTGSARRMS